MLILIALCVIVYLLWPKNGETKTLTVSPAVPAAPSYQSAVANLSSVRSRLVQTSNLTDEAKTAIDTLTLALVAGSDK